MRKHFQILAALVLIFSTGLSAVQAYPGNGGGYPGYPGDGGGYPGYPSYPDQHLFQNAPQIVRAMYRGMLFREPDADGFRNAVNLIRTKGRQGLTDLAMGIGNSAEYYQNIEPRYPNVEIVRNLYRELLGREGEPQGVYNWASLLDQGRSGETLSGFVNSEEFRRRFVY